MARIGILTCSNATQDLGCSSVSCLHDLRKRKGAFERYSDDEKLDLIGIINCAGCPTLAGPDKLLGRIRALTEFRLDTIHFTYCMDVLCPFKAKYKALLEEHFPNIEIIVGTHESHVTNEQFREDVKGLFCQSKRSMVDVIKGR
ncbi:CGGC domain protein [Peptococcaceae bacterium CEB3]|nr:CGGC domain protein [Peptococcaceae bacterium CEB3]